MRTFAAWVQMRPLKMQPQKTGGFRLRCSNACGDDPGRGGGCIRDQRWQNPGRSKRHMRRTDALQGKQTGAAIHHQPRTTIHLQIQKSG